MRNCGGYYGWSIILTILETFEIIWDSIKRVTNMMTINPFVVSADTLAYNAVNIIQEQKITSIVVVKENKVIGALNIHDLFRSGLM